jgi:hypothetical protein
MRLHDLSNKTGDEKVNHSDWDFGFVQFVPHGKTDRAEL